MLPRGRIANTVFFAGFVGASIAGNATAYAFAGPTASVTATAGQRLVGSAGAALALASGGPQNGDVGLCYQVGAGPVINFTGSYITTEFTTTRTVYTVSSSVVPGAGTYTVGYCVRNGGGALALADNDYVNGWVQVLNP